MIAKRVLASIVANNSSLVNFGLMTFYQGNYFPYFSLSGTTTSTQTTFIRYDRLNEYNCYDDNDGPVVDLHHQRRDVHVAHQHQQHLSHPRRELR